MSFKWQLINDSITKSDKKALTDFINEPNQRFTNGRKVKEFEKKWSEWLGVKHSVMINSGAMGNYMTISIMKEKMKRKTGEVIVPSMCWVSDVSSIVNLGLKPVFVDIDFSNLAMSLENIKKATNDQTLGIVLVHLLGFNALTDELLDFVKERNLYLIEDVCESHGVQHNGLKGGTFGDISVFSFYFGHHMTTIEGGVVCTNDFDVHDLARMFRSHGMTREASEQTQERYRKKYPDLNPLFTFAVPGFNVRSHELCAVMGRNQLKRLDSNIEKRCENFNIWLDALDKEKFITQFAVEGSSNFALPLILKEKNSGLFNSVQQVLRDQKIEFRKGTAGGGNQYRQPYFEKFKGQYRLSGDLTTLNHIHDFGLYIGNHTDLEEDQIIRACTALNELR